MLNVQIVIAAIKDHVGQEFYTPSEKLPFTYELKGSLIKVSRTDHRILFEENVTKACDLLNEDASGATFSKVVRGPSYIKALLTDERITGIPNAVKTGQWFAAILMKEVSWTDKGIGTQVAVRKFGPQVEVSIDGGSPIIISKSFARASLYRMDCPAA